MCKLAMLITGVAIAVALFMFTIAYAKCDIDANNQLFQYIIESTVSNARVDDFTSRKDTAKWVRTEVRNDLNELHELANLRQDSLIVFYFTAEGRPEVAQFIIDNGGHRFLARAVICFKRHYADMLRACDGGIIGVN